MTEYTSEHFSEHMRGMSDNALLRIKAIQSSADDPDEIDSMRPGDEYYSAYGQKVATAYIETSVQTTTRAYIHDNLADATVQEDMPTGLLAGMLGSMLLSLSDEHDMSPRGGESPLSFDLNWAQTRIQEAWMLATIARQEHQTFTLHSTGMGVTALLSIVVAYDAPRGVWRLGIEHQSPTQLYIDSNPETGDIELVEYVSGL